jgi:hypothetical protein
MIDVFISRPTWVAGEFEKGLAGFLGLLTDLGLRPRTLGATDYPNKAPLDEVIRLMESCAGVVILGYPQIVATSGTVKGQQIAGQLALATEWNHIEAALAYARGLPLLVIHHIGIKRGIFDRGAISSFIYELDLTDPAWPLFEKVRGAVQTWKTRVLTPKLQGVRASEVGPSGAPESFDLSEQHIRVLQLLAEAGDHGLTVEDLAETLGTKAQKARYYLDGLLRADFIGDDLVSGEPTVYYLDERGRTLLVGKGLL